MNKNFKIVTATQLSEREFWEKSALGKSLKYYQNLRQPGVSYSVSLFVKNELGLSELYQNTIERCQASDMPSKPQYIIFAHDDLSIKSIDMFDLLLERFDAGYGIVGLAGSSSVDFKYETIAWHNTEQHFWSGFVSHPTEDAFYTNSFGKYPQEVISLDGLFMAVDLEKIKGFQLYDKTFTFDFYDLDACMTAHHHGVKLSTVGIFTEHMSHGGGIRGERYAKMQEQFVNKWSKIYNNKGVK